MKKNILLAVFIIFASVFSALAEVQSVSLSTKADKTRITIGDRLSYVVTLSCPQDVKLIPPQKEAQLGLWEVKDLKVYQENKETLNNYLNYTLTTYTTGEVMIPEITFKLADSKNNEITAKTQETKVTVESVLGLAKGGPGLRDIKPPVSLNIPVGHILFWLIITLAALYGAWRWYESYRKKHFPKSSEPLVPAVPPYQTALEELEKLKNSSLLKDGKVKEFYIALSDIIRKYLGAVYSFEAMDKTTAEIYHELKHKVTDKKVLISLKEFFEDCDFVKFAKYRPEDKTAWEDFEKAENIVK